VIVPDVFQIEDGRFQVVGLSGQQAVDDLDGLNSGIDTGLLDPIAENDVECAQCIGINGFSEAHIHVGNVLKLQGNVLDHMAQQGAFAHAFDETAFDPL